jgi:hypothetical protein
MTGELSVVLSRLSGCLLVLRAQAVLTTLTALLRLLKLVSERGASGVRMMSDVLARAWSKSRGVLDVVEEKGALHRVDTSRVGRKNDMEAVS